MLSIGQPTRIFWDCGQKRGNSQKKTWNCLTSSVFLVSGRFVGDPDDLDKRRHRSADKRQIRQESDAANERSLPGTAERLDRTDDKELDKGGANQI